MYASITGFLQALLFTFFAGSDDVKKLILQDRSIYVLGMGTIPSGYVPIPYASSITDFPITLQTFLPGLVLYLLI